MLHWAELQVCTTVLIFKHSNKDDFVSNSSGFHHCDSQEVWLLKAKKIITRITVVRLLLMFKWL